jgi:hypothetical protein
MRELTRNSKSRGNFMSRIAIAHRRERLPRIRESFASSLHEVGCALTKSRAAARTAPALPSSTCTGEVSERALRAAPSVILEN